MKVSFGIFAEYSARRMNEFVNDLERALQKVFDGGTLVVGGGTPVKKHMAFSATWDPGSVANGAQTTTTVTATGVLLADASPVMVGFSNSLQGMQLTGYVSADDVITVVLRNGTGGAIDLASGTLRVTAWRY